MKRVSSKKLAASLVGVAMVLPMTAEAGLFDFLRPRRPQPQYYEPLPEYQPEQRKPQRRYVDPSTYSISGKTVEVYQPGGVPWVIKKSSWDASDEAKYSEFVESIYESGCTSVPGCMKGTGNWYRDKDPKGMDWFADCGRFPYLLRSYFAFHNGLPFMAATEANRRDPNDPNQALQYSAKGNFISKRWAAKSGTDGYRFVKSIVGSVYSAVFRVDPRLDVSSGVASDFYHVALNRQNVRPGTVVYDPNGHIATVAKVTKEGKIILLDSHPDNSVSRVTYTKAFIATSMVQAGGLKNWRPISIVNGKSVAASNAQSPGFSLEQFVGDQPNQGGFSTAKWKTSDGIIPSKRYMDVVRARLSMGAVKYQPLIEIKAEVENICLMMQDRIASVNAAIEKGIDQKSIPGGVLPSNIYGTSGEWEEYSTPSRDARLKTAVNEFYTDVERMYTLYKARDPKVIYDGTDLVGEMLSVFEQASNECQLSYEKSNGTRQNLNFDSFAKRLYAMSFDPYHCVERRMGATSSAELASCQQSSTKEAWYQAEQNIRNSLNRPYEKKMGWSLSDLQRGKDVEAGVGVKVKEPVDVGSYLRSIR